MLTKVEREVRFLKLYAVVATLVCGALFVTLFTRDAGGSSKFGEIDVERINVVEADGTLRMVISNKERQHPGIVNGKLIERDYPRPPGMLFFNHLGDEMGGLVFDENGGNGHFGSLTFDKVRNDQAVGFRYLESDNGTYTTGLEVWHQPNIPSDEMMAGIEKARALTDESARDSAFQALTDAGKLTTQRLFLGKYRNNKSALILSDLKGNPRISMTVAAEGEAKLDFLNDAGEIVFSLPPASEN